MGDSHRLAFVADDALATTTGTAALRDASWVDAFANEEPGRRLA
jgi:hypothetical protein